MYTQKVKSIFNEIPKSIMEQHQTFGPGISISLPDLSAGQQIFTYAPFYDNVQKM